MENQKTLGTDGSPIEYYKEFHEYLKNDLSQPFNNTLFYTKAISKNNE